MAKYSALSESYEKEPDKWDGNSLGKFSENLGIVEVVKKEPFNRVISTFNFTLVELSRELN